MDDKNKFLVPSIVIGLAVLIGMVIWVGKAQVNVSVSPPSVSVAPGAVNVTPGAVNVSNPQQPAVFGSAAGDTTNWTAGSFSSDLNVGGTATLNNITATGSVALSGTTTFSGTTVGIGRTQTITMTSATNTPCAVQNTSGVNRIVTGVFADFTATTPYAASIGSFVVGTSTGPTVTSTSAFFNNNQLAKSATLDIINTTSTFTSIPYATWRSGEWFTFNVGGTSTQAGTCYIKYN